MYDKNRIEDSLEFVRQMKEFYDSDDGLDEFDPLEEQDSDELFVNLAYHIEPENPHKEDAVQRSHAMGDPFVVTDASVLQEQRRLAEERLRLEQEETRRRQAEQEQQKRLAEERLRLEQEEARRRQAEQEQQRRLAEERLRLEQEEARRRQAEQEQQKRLAEERHRLEQEEARRRQAELAEQKRLEEERRRLEEETERRRLAELQEKQRQEEERRKIEEERKKLAEEQRRQEEARRQLEEERRQAQEEAKKREAELAEKRRLAEERQRLEEEEAKKREAELAEKKRLAEERKRLEQEEARKREAELAEKRRLAEERQRLEEEEKRRQAELQEKQRQEAERRKIEEERRKLVEEQKRQEQVRRQLEEERQRLVEEQLQRELEEQRRLLAEQARRAQQEKARKEAEEKERRRKLVLEEEKRKQELQAREEEERRRQAEEEKKQQQQAAAQKQNPEMPAPVVSAPADGDAPDSEIERLRKRAEELKRQAEMATLEARMRQLQLEAEGISAGESVMPQQTANAGVSSSGATPANTGATNTDENNIPMPMLSIPGVQPGTVVSNKKQQAGIDSQDGGEKQKLSKEEIDSIFAKELKKAPSSDSSYQQRKMMLQKQAERLKRKREETGDRLPMEIAKEKAVQAKKFTMGMAWKLREFVLDKMTDPENAESREKAKKILSNVLVVVICVFIAFLVSSFVTNFVAHPTKVEGESMETTLTDGDTVIIQKLSYYFGTPDRYDVVVFPVYNSETYYIKRVIGLPGETVQIDEGKIFINDKELEDDIYGKDEYIDDPGDAGEPITLASDEYFVLGDNRNMSTDSRSSYVGVIKKKNIVGKAWRRVLPFSKAGKIQQ